LVIPLLSLICHLLQYHTISPLQLVIPLLSLTSHLLKYLTILSLLMVLRHRLLVLVKLHICHLYPWIMCYLFVPSCPFNLISISKLTRSLNYTITFSSNSFFIQGLSTGKTIGTWSESQGLYYIQHSSIHHLWCFCIARYHSLPFGLSKFRGVKSIGSSFTFEFIGFWVMSEHLFQAVPQKIHVTLWYCWLWCLAPSRVSSTSGYRYYVTFIDDFSRWT